ncbi:MAG TPA: alpha/beta fold hydrolase [Pseudoduganella sp.]
MLFLAWALVSTGWLANSYRTRGVNPALLHGSVDADENMLLQPRAPGAPSGLVFICGSGVAAEAYVPMLRPLADAGFPVVIIKLPLRFAPLDSHKDEALRRVRRAMAAHGEVLHWVVAGHSLGGALAARLAHEAPDLPAALVLVGTTHPKQQDLSGLRIPVTKVFASNDGVARKADVMRNKPLLPAQTRWIEIEGGNHSQFGHYGHQLLDGDPAVSREAQQAIVTRALLSALKPS